MHGRKLVICERITFKVVGAFLMHLLLANYWGDGYFSRIHTNSFLPNVQCCFPFSWQKKHTALWCRTLN